MNIVYTFAKLMRNIKLVTGLTIGYSVPFIWIPAEGHFVSWE
jgi:hypothetical protein